MGPQRDDIYHDMSTVGVRGHLNRALVSRVMRMMPFTLSIYIWPARMMAFMYV